MSTAQEHRSCGATRQEPLGYATGDHQIKAPDEPKTIGDVISISGMIGRETQNMYRWSHHLEYDLGRRPMATQDRNPIPTR